MSPIEADAVWDAWRAAHAERPELEPEDFAAEYAHARGAEAAAVLEALATLLAVEDAAPLPSLFELLQQQPDDGRRFAGFRLLRELGEGSTGIVFEAVDAREGAAGRRVALKILNPLLGAARARREVLEREARIAAALDHPGIVRLIDSGVERGYAWIATELVAGRTVDAWIDAALAPGARRALALDVGAQVCAALQHAHAQGLVHRDLKPANLMRDPAGRVKVLDFGLARVEGAAFAVSRTGEAVGTPLYMPPEQLRGERDVDGRADVYSLGLVLLELATGRRLSLGAGALRTLDRIASGRARLPRRAYDGLPPALAGALSRCLEPHRDDRYAGAGALRADLEALRDGRPPQLARIGRVGRARRYVARHPGRAVAGAVAAVGFAVGSVWLWDLAQRTPVSISAWPADARVAVDGAPQGERAPRTADLRPGPHVARVAARIAGVQREFTHAFEVPARGRLHLALPVGPAYSPPDPLVLAPDGAEVRYVQLAARPADRRDHRAPFPLELQVDGRVVQLGDGLLALGLPPGSHVLRLDAPGFRPREVALELDAALLCVPQVPLDPEDSPWHTLALSGPLDPALEELTLENLALRWDSVQQDRFSETLVQRVGLGTVDVERRGTLSFSLALPFAAERVVLLSIADPELGDEPDAWLIEVGPTPDWLVSVGASNAPGVLPERASEPLPGDLLREGQAPLDAAWAAARAAGLDTSRVYVRWTVLGPKVLALRSNALARRLGDGRALWDPALALRVPLPGSSPPARAAELEGVPRVVGPARRVVDLDGPGAADAVRALDGGPLDRVPRESRPGAVGGRDCDGDGVDDFLLWWRAGGGTRLALRSGRGGAPLWGVADLGPVHSAVLVHDADGDGGADVLLGIPQSAAGQSLQGRLELRSGRDGRVLGTRVGLRGETLGEQLAALGDVDGDGRPEVAVASYEYPGGGWGHARVLRLPQLDDLHVWRGRGQADHFGNRLAVPGDVDGDGAPDVAVAAYDADETYWDSGAVSCFSGRSGALLWTVEGRCCFDKLGGSLAPAGDVDGDGRGDLLTHSWSLGAQVLSGATGRLLRVYPGHPEVRGVLPCDIDLDGDGRPEHALKLERQGRDAFVLRAASDGEALLELTAAGLMPPVPGPLLEVRGAPRRTLVVGLASRDGGGASPVLMVLE